MRARRWSTLPVAAALIAAATACRPAITMRPAPIPAVSAPAAAVVRLEPPDSEPQWMYVPSNWATDSARWGGRFTRDIVMLLFRQTATQSERQAAVEAVHGTVVGGKRLAESPGLGIYLLLLPHDPTNDRLFAAIDALRKLPNVRWAMPYSMMIGTGG